MITDEDVRLFYQRQTKPGVYGGFGSLQIYRGKSPYIWKNAHPGGCNRHLELFKQSRAIPEYCFDCYKVLITPRTVLELFKLLMVFDRISLPEDNTRKCMTEGREDCAGTYKGFVYCREIDEGKAVKNIIREIIATEISPDVRITLKRGCSEFSQAYPKFSPKKPGVTPMQYNVKWRALEEAFDKNTVFPQTPSNAYLEKKTAFDPAEVYAMQYWLSYAATIGDNSYLPIAGCTLAPLPQLKNRSFTFKAP